MVHHDRRRTRKDREQLRRRGDILLVARDVLHRDGISGFSIDEVANEVGYSRGALYQYFPSKEELVIALALETAETRVKLWERASTFEARPRERLAALGEVTAILYPRHVLPEVIAFANAVRSKTSETAQQRLRELDREDYRLAAQVVRDALDAGDLRLSPGITVESLVFGLTAFVRGMFASIASAVPAADLGVGDPRQPMRLLGARLLDGLGWRPLSTEWDYRETMRRIYSEVFPPSFLAAQGLLSERERPPSPAGGGGESLAGKSFESTPKLRPNLRRSRP